MFFARPEGFTRSERRLAYWPIAKSCGALWVAQHSLVHCTNSGVKTLPRRLHSRFSLAFVVAAICFGHSSLLGLALGVIAVGSVHIAVNRRISNTALPRELSDPAFGHGHRMLRFSG